MWEKGQDRGKVAPTMIGRGPATNGKDVELPIFYLDCEVEVQITMGFVYERISFLNMSEQRFKVNKCLLSPHKWIDVSILWFGLFF